MKIGRLEAELFHADGQSDMTEVIVPFRNFANAPKNRLNIRKYGGKSEDWPCEMLNCPYTVRFPDNGRMCLRVALGELVRTARDDRLERESDQKRDPVVSPFKCKSEVLPVERPCSA
jgi:hypothetical protein